MVNKEVTTIRLEPYWKEKLEKRAEKENESLADVVRRRIRFGLSKREYREIEDLAIGQDVTETDILNQGMKFTSIAMNPDLSFADAIKPVGEIAEELMDKQEEED